MKAMLLAAGRGERMRPLTDHTPKPLLLAGGKPLIVWHLEKLAAAGFTEAVINCAWLGEQLPSRLGDGRAFGLDLHYSIETQALETAGGIAQALPQLQQGMPEQSPFAVISSDIWSDADYACLHQAATPIRAGRRDCWCLMVENPPHHQRGDFLLNGEDLRLAPAQTSPHPGQPALTYAGIGVFSPRMFSGLAAGTRSPLRPWLEQAISAGRAAGSRHPGRWFDIGTPARLDELNQLLGKPHRPAPDHVPLAK
ncbi:MAG: nucleotidyltransferase family protein [Lautropia sp.]|nr:nucleotidyltransferase family protein [Lautropia sp.]